MTALYLMGVVCFVIAVLLWAVIRGGKREGAAEANADTAERQVEAMKQSETVKDERLARMADAGAAVATEPAARIRDRMQRRRADTR